ncbi:MAG: M14 family zinc carboxypeptidase [Pseudomonadota bacterium]
MPRCGLLLGLLLPLWAFGQSTVTYWPDANYDPSVPTVESVLGYASGERITWTHDARRYFDVLAEARPDQVLVRNYAKSWEGRDLYYVVVASAENMARLDEVKAGMQRLRNAGNLGADAAADLIASQPAVTWLGYAVHGNEVSGTDTAMFIAYHLLASRGDPRVADILRDTIVVLDPIQNPDGRDRFIHHYEMAEGIEPNSDRLYAEQDEPWPGGRTNHYLFDLNRDWFILTQPETLGRIAAVQEFYPVAFVDAHEMGSDQTYYFAPEAVPYNPNLAADQRASLTLFGKNNARWFDRFGLDYFTREVYDAFYPGYGASWPSYFGSVAMTYEQGSARGLLVRQYDGVEVSFYDTVRNQFVTSMSTAEVTAANREKLLTDFYDYQRSAISEGRSESVRSYLIPTQRDQAGADKLAALLVRQGVEVGVADAAFSACGERYAAGTYVISLAQPAKRLLRTLLDADTPIDETFVAEQERRRAKALRDEIYDVTAWSLPLMMNVTANPCSRVPSVATSAATEALIVPGSVTGPANAVSYLVPAGDASSVRLLAAALRGGLAVKSADEAFTHQDTRYASGTLILDAADNPADVRQQLADLAAATGADVIATDDTWVTDGPNFGSGRVVRHRAPRVAMIWDEPTRTYSAGNARFIIERQFGYPVTIVRADRLTGADLGRFDVMILPETSGSGYSRWGEAGVELLADWVQRGGVLIGLGNATRYLADPQNEFLDIRREFAIADDEDGNGKNGKDDDEEPLVPAVVIDDVDAYQESIANSERTPDSVGGILARADVDPDHWLAAGVAETLNVLVRGGDIYTPIKLGVGTNVVRFQSAEQLLASGYLWEQNREQLAFKPFAVVQASGRGFVVGFTQDPTVRAYLDGLNVVFMNAIFRGSAHARPRR